MALPLWQKFVQRLRWLLEALHCHELVGVAVLLLGLLQDSAMDWVCDVENCSGLQIR